MSKRDENRRCWNSMRRELKLGPPRSRYAPVICKPDMVDSRARHTTVELYKLQGSEEEDQGAWGFLSDRVVSHRLRMWQCACTGFCTSQVQKGER